MLNEKAIKKVEKALGVKVQEGYNGKYYVEYDNKICSWRASQKWGAKEGVKEASGWHVRRVDDHSDLHTDYFAGYHLDNITQMIHSVKPPEPKFKLGDLVEFKDNKRQQRYGQAGAFGVVVDVSNCYYKVQIAGSTKTTSHESERDLKLVA